MLFNKKTKDHKNNKPNNPGKPQPEQRPETEEERWERWANGKFHDFIFQDKGGRWRVTAQSDFYNSWIVLNTESIGRDEVSAELLWRKLAQALVHRQKAKEEQAKDIPAFVEYLAWIEAELTKENKRVRSTTLQAILEGIGRDVFNGNPYSRPKKEVINE